MVRRHGFESLKALQCLWSILRIMSLPILYSFRRCPYAMRARMALYASGQSVELREVVLRDKPAHMLEVSPKGTVPVLMLPDGRVIDESLDVMRWALSAADPLKWLLGSLPDMLALIDICDGDFKYHLDRYKYTSRYEGAVSLEHRTAAEGFLQQLEVRLAETAYLFGDAPRLADYAIMPFVRQFANADKSWFEHAPYEHLRAWLSAMLGSDTFLSVMQKYPQWHTGDEPVVFPAGKD